jgi:hypothetical protein
MLLAVTASFLATVNADYTIDPETVPISTRREQKPNAWDFLPLLMLTMQ